ncbi:hypothetical protein CLAFUW4_06588 [Fulvia fulva]|uniref:F-box domain-containing protein n=1 Tax=Passalora fulva TaxID=5499 RepID=A0A9Q8PBB2_PASFU|nr:uncharacterized protein CLAFUR5_06733 [Fulvia fulva]KAK4621919.1 hypothetical protein CLAFUR4_06596 [Fulvia fulva]KAK4623006.1 hypothetical protein CLAFUR0_06590 [Fulvia fulva]UJO19290.1 hypothetical protein CLAFUR5_06733 [Fulvia fulva]WPV16643.1 hypothetical protein CLAFUW4_06588 [Fulvia fulva]WPV30946.1 hypothetical protein CLAFUW7_06587 [Fulvia fulva]
MAIMTPAHPSQELTCTKTSNKAPSSAVAQVFAIPELLEHILIQLGLDAYNKAPELQEPAKELFTLQRISRTFQAVVAESPRLQSLMCLSEDTAYPQYRHAGFTWLIMRVYNVSIVYEEQDGPWGKVTLAKSKPYLATSYWVDQQFDRRRRWEAQRWKPSWHRMIAAPVKVEHQCVSFSVEEACTLWELVDRYRYVW